MLIFSPVALIRQCRRQGIPVSHPITTQMEPLIPLPRFDLSPEITYSREIIPSRFCSSNACNWVFKSESSVDVMVAQLLLSHVLVLFPPTRMHDTNRPTPSQLSIIQQSTCFNMSSVNCSAGEETAHKESNDFKENKENFPTVTNDDVKGDIIVWDEMRLSGPGSLAVLDYCLLLLQKEKHQMCDDTSLQEETITPSGETGRDSVLCVGDFVTF
eukprot:GHVU01166955.1.p1 GENE.GHVU01166955.1~~GHVU01166955.1.p1  ORF type:complete len:214 (-),score=24.79 GHVU01166955.1:669-1310(-)